MEKEKNISRIEEEKLKKLIREKILKDKKIEDIQEIEVFETWWNPNCVTVIEEVNVIKKAPLLSLNGIYSWGKSWISGKKKAIINGSSPASRYSVWFAVHEPEQRKMSEFTLVIEMVGEDKKKIIYDSLEGAQKKVAEIRKELTNESGDYWNNPFLLFAPLSPKDSVLKEVLPYRKSLVEIYPEILDNHVKPLDIIKVWKTSDYAVPFQHVGIYLGDGWIFHFGRDKTENDNKIMGIVEQETFLHGGTSEIIRLHPIIPFKKPEKIIEQIAKVCVKAGDLSNDDDWKYNLFFNNCEHLANLLIRGVSYSEQVDPFTNKYSNLKEKIKENDNKLDKLVLPNNPKIKEANDKIKEINDYGKKLTEVEKLKKDKEDLSVIYEQVSREKGEVVTQADSYFSELTRKNTELDLWKKIFPNQTPEEVSNNLKLIKTDLSLEKIAHEETKREKQDLQNKLQIEQQNHQKIKQHLNSILASREQQIIEQFIAELKLISLNGKSSTIKEVIETIKKLIEKSPVSPNYSTLQNTLRESKKTIANLEKQLADKTSSDLDHFKKTELAMLKKFFPEIVDPKIFSELKNATSYQQAISAHDKLLKNHIDQKSSELINQQNEKVSLISIGLLSSLTINLLMIFVLIKQLRKNNSKKTLSLSTRQRNN